MVKYQFGKAFSSVMLKGSFYWCTLQFTPVESIGEGLIPKVCHLSLLVVNIINIPQSSAGWDEKEIMKRRNCQKE